MNTAKKVGFYTLGCKLNFSETSTIARAFREHGYQRVEFEEPADVYVVNTCSVTENADKECRRIVKKALKTSPDAFIVVVGCYAQLKPEEIAGIEGVDLVLGASEKFKIMEYLDVLDKTGKAQVFSCEISDVNFYVDAFSVGDRTRAFLKVQDGCDYSCAFCTIPLARGKSRSDSVANTVSNARKLAETGVKEIVLTGVNIGDFGKGNQTENKRKEETFLDLIQELDQVEGIERFRISSIEPNLLKDEIIAFVAASKRFVPHFHIPLQSGSDKVLKAMRRRYLRDLYQERVQHIKSLMPHCCIGVDVITGFPGETEQDFRETYDFIHSLPVSYLHVFTYSERANTDAAGMPEAVPLRERQKRNQMLRILSEKKKREFYSLHLGETRTVLFEEERQGEFMEGFTDNYIKVKTTYDPASVNTLREMKLAAIGTDGVVSG
jgi:threonylcarbamoyladenosine tRNA methylthiotransferase MtaB